MSKNVDFEIGTIVTDTFLDSIQELLTGSVQNVRLDPSGVTDRITAALCGDLSFDKRASVNIGGKYCFTDVGVTSNSVLTQTTGPKKIYLSTTASGTPQQPNFVVTVDSSPPVSSYIKQIGTADHNVLGVLSNIKMTTGVQADSEQYNSFTFKSIANQPDEVLLTFGGQSTQISTAPVAGIDSDPSLTPTKAISVGYDVASVYTENFYVDTAGRAVFKDRSGGAQHAVLQWADNDDTGAVDGVLTINREFSSHISGTNGGLGFTSWSARVEQNPTLDDENRIEITNTGYINWGDGSNAPDISIFRLAANKLTTALNDQIYMDYAIPARVSPATTSPADGLGNLLTNKTYVDTSIITAISESKRFAFFITP